MHAESIPVDESLNIEALSIARRHAAPGVDMPTILAQQAAQRVAERDPRIVGIAQMKDAALTALTALMGNPTSVREALARGHRTRVLMWSFRPHEIATKVRRSHFENMVTAGFTGQGGPLDVVKKEQSNGLWIPCAVSFEDTYDICREPAGERAKEGEFITVPKDDGSMMVDVYDERINVIVRCVDLNGAEDIAQDVIGKNQPQRVNVQVAGSGGDNGAILAQLMQQIQQVNEANAELRRRLDAAPPQAPAQTPARERKRPGRKPKAPPQE